MECFTRKMAFYIQFSRYTRDIRVTATGLPYAVFCFPLASMTIAYRKTAINNFCDISRIFFFFLLGGAFW